MSQSAAAEKQINLTLPDGAVRTFTAGVTGAQVAADISKSLAKAALAIYINGALSDLSLPIDADADISLVTRKDDDALELIRHDCAHVLAEAVQTLFPGTQVTIGPNIENGFFYDFARNEPFSSEDLEAIEKEMRRIVERGAAFTREVWDRAEAIQYFTDKGELYKAELIRDLPEDEDIKIYKQGDWLDLCRGPHMPTVKHVGTGFKLLPNISSIIPAMRLMNYGPCLQKLLPGPAPPSPGPAPAPQRRRARRGSAPHSGACANS